MMGMQYDAMPSCITGFSSNGIDQHEEREADGEQVAPEPTLHAASMSVTLALSQ